MAVRSLLVFLVAFFVYVACDCPNGWLTHHNRCYHFSHDTEDWTGAVTMCKINGGELVQIENSTESTYLETQAKQNAKSYWMALTDYKEEGMWHWLYTDSLVGAGDFFNWGAGQPDNGRKHNQNCAFINITSGYWADINCHASLNYICERAPLYV